LIERVVEAVPSVRGAAGRGGLRLGIGDDATVGSPRTNYEWVLSCDAFFDGVHFRAKSYPPDSVGYKALVRAASDLAAMGATPRLFLLTLALPPGRTGKWLDELLGGMCRAARTLGMRLAGGDTTRSDKVAISVTVIGEIGRGLAVKRSGARPGDVLHVSGRLGRAALGLELMSARGGGGRAMHSAGLARLVRQHLRPQIRIQLGAWLARHRVASAMMDLSDGLSTDLSRLCKASAVGARLCEEQIPRVKIPDAAARRLRGRRLDPLLMALHGGEDYELLFTVPRENLGRLQGAPEFAEITAIGQIERGNGIVLTNADGLDRPLKPGGWDPFVRR
jgi:thiamine-monophosphate kinase